MGMQVTDSVAREAVNSVAASAEQGLSELADGAQGEIGDKTAADLITLLSSPAKSSRSYKELQHKVHETLRVKFTHVTDSTKDKFLGSLERVWARFDDGITKLRSPFLQETTNNVMLIGTEMGLCNSGLFPLGKK